MAHEGLFGDLPERPAPERRRMGSARVSRPQRDQLAWEVVDPDRLVEAGHPVRLVWSFVQALELSPFYEAIEARADGPGRDAIDPALLLALWLWAVIDGVGSAREVARRCLRDLPYRWLCGGVGVNHHALSDFRATNVEMLDALLTDSVTALVSAGLVKLETLAHDSLKVRASAGSSSFRRGGSLIARRAKMAARIETLKAELEADPNGASARQRAARERAAREGEERCKRAQEEMRKLEKAQAKRRKKDRTDRKTGQDKAVRVSTTDPEARIIAFSNSERRPGYSLQITGDPKTLVAVGLSVHDSVDAGQIKPALEQIGARYGEVPKTLLADCGFCTKDDIAFAHEQRVNAIIPSNNEAKKGDSAYATTYKNSLPGIAQWRARMVQPATKDLYKLRCRIECVFAQMRNRGLRLLRVRGKRKVKGEVLLQLLAHNLLCGERLRLAALAA